MKITLNLHGNEQPSIELIAESEAEKSILGLIGENNRRRWQTTWNYNYRASGLERLALVVDPESVKPPEPIELEVDSN